MESIRYDLMNDAYLNTMVKNRKSFEVLGVGEHMKNCVLRVETAIEGHNLSCRVYTENRSASIATGLLTVGMGVIAAATIAAHNIATFNPDYEVGKNLMHHKITVKFKK